MDLSVENPWWFEGGLWQDSDLLKVKSSLLRYVPKPITPAECRSGGVITLRGPRRAGKTVTLKLLVAELLESQKGWKGREIVWTALDTFRTLAQVEDHLVAIQAAHHPKLLIVDEVTSVTGWQRVIKKLKDNGTFSEATLLLTGSSAFDLKAGAERMAGRRGSVERPDRVLLPMAFRDFSEQLRLNGLDLPPGDQTKKYLEVGGFPFRVDAFLSAEKTGKPWESSRGFQVFDDVVFYEITRRRLDRNIALEILGRLSQIQNHAVSFHGFAKPLTISLDTARKYLAALGDAFLLATISSFDTARHRVAPRKDRKFLWIDPALGFLAEWIGQGTAADEAARGEWAVGAELLRRYERRLFEGLSSPRNVFTWKSSGGNEIDFLVFNAAEKLMLPVEVKYQQSISDWDFQVMERAFKKGWLVTRQTDRERPLSRAMALGAFLGSSVE